MKGKQTHAKKVCKQKVEVKVLITQTFVGMSSKNDRVLDNGCSNHMIGEEYFLVEFKSFSQEYVRFEDGKKGRVKGIGKVAGPDFLALMVC